MRAAPFFKTTAAALPEKTLSSENLSIWFLLVINVNIPA
jgi:hypothetical protein